jgi:tRNA pseudouridine55 synthase
MGRNRKPNGIELDGLLLVDKPTDWTSHDVVNFVRGRYRLAKVGHGGTLDPMATGLLVLLLGKGTRMSEQVMQGEKTYEGTVVLGSSTDTQDREGRILETHPVPAGLTEAELLAHMATLTGEILQMPPMVSALKKDGVPLYKLARKGQIVEREARPVIVYELTLLGFRSPEIEVRVRCGKGTYVRTLAHDLGAKIGCGAHLGALRRTVSGTFRVADAITVDAMRGMELDDLRQRVFPLPA